MSLWFQASKRNILKMILRSSSIFVLSVQNFRKRPRNNTNRNQPWPSINTLEKVLITGTWELLFILLFTFFYHHLFPQTHFYLHPHRLPAITTLLSRFINSFSFFSFLLNPSTLLPWPRAVCLVSIYDSVSILLVSSVCSLNYIYRFNHIVLVFLWLDSFT